MPFLNQVFVLLKKDILLEFRERYAIGGLMLYVLSTVFIAYLSFRTIIDVVSWNALFWIILIFAAFNSISHSFSRENDKRKLYLYTLASPQAIIVSKILYNILLMVLLSLLSVGVYTLLIGSDVLREADIAAFFLAVVFGAVGFACVLTMIAGIAAQTNNNFGITAILGLPVILPFLLTLIRFSKNALDGISWSVNFKYALVLLLINVVVLVLSYILFPYLWRD